MSGILDAPRSVGRVVAALAIRSRRSWRGTVVTGLAIPVLFLLSLGFGLGSLLPSAGFGTSGHDAVAVGYGQFIAPGLLAASSLQFAIAEATEPVMAGFKWQRTYDAVIASPVTATELAAAQLVWIAVRVMAVAAMFALVASVLGFAAGPSIVVATASAVLGGVAAASPAMAYAATARDASAFTVLTQFVVVPMTLVSGTFFPLASLPHWLAAVAWALPLAHSVALTRALALGAIAPVDLAHLAVLAAWLGGGWALTVVRFKRRLAH